MFVLTLSLLSAGKAHAASITVATGNDETATNNSCSLSEAIANISDQATTYPDCVAGDGNNDKIILPSGTIYLTANLPLLNKSVVIEGAGMGQTIVDGDGSLYTGFQFYGTGTENFTVTKLKLSDISSQGILAANVNFNANQVEVYGSADKPGSTTNMSGGISFGNSLGSNLTVEMNNVYVHDLQTPSGALNAILISGIGVDNGITNVNLNNITVSNIHSTGADIVNAMAFSMFDGVRQTINANVKNVTINNIENSTTAYGLAAVAAAGTGNAVATVNVTNSTISHIRSTQGPFGGGGGIGAGGFEISPSVSATVNLNVENTVVSDSTVNNTTGINCSTLDLTSGFGGTGTPSLNINSNGGNITDDTTCSSYFTKPTDKNNITTLKDFLGPISNNGGYVPTIPLLPGSPAIDHGITVSDLTTDARGVTRPQGQAYDSGAYEYVPTASLAGTGENSVLLLAMSATTVFLSTIVIAYIHKRQS